MNNHLKTAVLIVTFLSSGLANARDVSQNVALLNFEWVKRHAD